jgi:hypothetical protein
LERYGRDAAVASIGPAGEQKLLTAGVFGSDIEGLPGAVCARGAMGSVMGSKGLKAIVVLGKGTYRIPIKNRDKFTEALKRYHEFISKTPQTAEVFPKYGTSAALMVLNEWEPFQRTTSGSDSSKRLKIFPVRRSMKELSRGEGKERPHTDACRVARFNVTTSTRIRVES